MDAQLATQRDRMSVRCNSRASAGIAEERKPPVPDLISHRHSLPSPRLRAQTCPLQGPGHGRNSPACDRTETVSVRANPHKTAQIRTEPNRVEPGNLDIAWKSGEFSGEIMPKSGQTWTNLDKSGQIRTPKRPILSPQRQIAHNLAEFSAVAERQPLPATDVGPAS